MSSAAMASFSPHTHFSATQSSSPHSKQHLFILHNKPFITVLRPKIPLLFLSPLKVSADNEVATSVTTVEPPPPEKQHDGSVGGSNGSVAAVVREVAEVKEVVVSGFKDPKWVGGTWDMKQFQKNGTTDWDAVIDAEARRRKWLEDNPESSSNDNPVLFDTSIIPWWAWMKRFHLPEAEKLNGRAAMVGFFMAYFVDSLTGVGLVDQMNNFFCKTLLFVAVAGVLLIRKNEDLDTLKKLWEETTFYDKQWQAIWQDENSSTSNRN